MSRMKSMVVAAATLVLSPLLFAANPASTPERVREVEVGEATLPEPVATLVSLFAAAKSEETLHPLEGEASGMGALEVVVARVNTDGRLVLACVDSKEAADRFLQAPIDKVTRREAKEH